MIDTVGFEHYVHKVFVSNVNNPDNTFNYRVSIIEGYSYRRFYVTNYVFRGKGTWDNCNAKNLFVIRKRNYYPAKNFLEDLEGLAFYAVSPDEIKKIEDIYVTACCYKMNDITLSAI